jgi:type III secretion protein C
MIKQWRYFLSIVLIGIVPLLGELPLDSDEDGHVINFSKVSALELVKFVSRIAGVNFIFKEDLLRFEVSFISNKATSAKKVLGAVIRILEEHQLQVFKETEDYYIIRESKEYEDTSSKKIETLITEDGRFFVYKLQYHKGSEIQSALKQITNEMITANGSSFDFINAIQSVQWISSTNSLFFSGSEDSIGKICALVKNLDTPLKQVFIEILVIETDIKNSLDFGLQWSANGKYKNVVEIDSRVKNPYPVGNGFDLSVIGDIIFHKGKSFLTLTSLVSMLQISGDSTIVLNQKIITQDNKESKIFVGDNIPFPGAVVQTIGNGQQTTANIEYRDIGVSLNITPMLGDNNIITLDISEEITEAMPHTLITSSQMQGIQTTKTNMITSVHVPDQHFLVLSGMTRSRQRKTKAGIPCLGGLPLIGRLFSKEEKEDEKRNILVFVKPHIINSIDDYQKLTNQENLL